jgi:type II secretory pathway component PulC
MRLYVALVFLALSGSLAAAEESKPAEAKPEPVRSKVPLRLVKILPETDQALLFDSKRGTHVLADVGSAIEGYTVKDIDDDQVFLESAAGTQVVLAAPPPARDRKAKPAAQPVASDPQPEDPYAEPKQPETKPVDPYAETKPVDPYADAPVRVTESPDAPVRVAEVPAVAPGPVPAAAPSAPAPAPAPAPADAPLTIPRADLTAALSNFGKLAASVRGSFTPTGAKLESVAEGSLFARVGLRAGDVITAVDNQPMHSLDDAATLYARAASARNVTLHVVRSDKPISLHVAIQ